MSYMENNVPAQMLIHQILRLISDRADALLERYNLKKGQAGILFVLEEYSGLSQRELAGYIGVKPPSITVALQKMEKQGYILREADLKDQRIIRLRNTEAGSACVGQIKEVFREMEDIIYEGMTREEVLLLRRLLRQIRDNLMKGQDPETMRGCRPKHHRECMERKFF